jgi:hypothetical protein
VHILLSKSEKRYAQMSTEKENILPGEAKKSLDSINRMNQIGLQRSEYPKWFTNSIALTIFLYFATIPLGTYFPVFMVLYTVYFVMSTKLGVKPSYSKPAIWILLVWFAAMVMFWVFVWYLRETYGLNWAPYAGGLIATSIYYIRYGVGKRTRATQRVKEETL